MPNANGAWQRLIMELNIDGETVAPRGLSVRERVNGRYSLEMPAWLDLEARKVNRSFMFAEAAWILKGSNRLDELTPFLKGYARYSDDGTFMRGAYGPKIMDQLPWVAECLAKDPQTRQAVLTIWRERPAESKDIPCTTQMQFLIRAGKLESIVTMRSQDVVLGFTYDVFTFSMVAEALRRLLTQNIWLANLKLGELHVNVGSLHLYERDTKRVEEWVAARARDEHVEASVKRVLCAGPETFERLVGELQVEAIVLNGSGR